jgi:ABC-type transport system involved in multi-copper enzyme maturation permease subunit
MRGLLRDTVQEFVDKKLAYWFGAFTIFFAILPILILKTADLGVGSADMIDPTTGQFTSALLSALAWGSKWFLRFCVVIAAFSAASAFPRMLERGRAEYYLSMPLSRGRLFLSKFLSLLVVYGGVILGCAVVSIVAFGAIHGVFRFDIVYVLLTAIVNLIIWLSIISLVGIFSGSASTAITAAFFVYAIELVLSFREGFIALFSNKAAEYLLTTFYYIIPKTGEIADLGQEYAMGNAAASTQPVLTSLLFAIVLVLVTIQIFRRREY